MTYYQKLLSGISRAGGANDLEVVIRAFAVSLGAHSAVGQKRKYNGEPYIMHPVEVALLVAEVTPDSNMISAALLHDVVEDTEMTLGDLGQMFDAKIVQYVSELTDVSKPEDGNRKTRKQIDLEHSRGASPEAKTVKLADLISNSSTITIYDPGFAVVYMREKRALLEVLKEGDSTLWERANKIAVEYEKSRRKT